MFKSLKEKLSFLKKKIAEEVIPEDKEVKEEKKEEKRGFFDFFKRKEEVSEVKKEEKQIEIREEIPKKEEFKIAEKKIETKEEFKKEMPTPKLQQIQKEERKEFEIKLKDESSFLDKIAGRVLSEEKIDEILNDLEIILLESDVALAVVEKIKESLKEQLKGKAVFKRTEVEDTIENALKIAIEQVLTQEKINFDKFIEEKTKPIKIMFVGVNGTGKTTVIAKIVYRLRKNNKSCVIAAGDTFRAGAIEQLEKHAERLGVKLIKHKAGSDPTAVSYDAVEHAKARNKDVVLIDTAGRMQTNVNLMDEMKKIKRVISPDMIIFVGDSLAGNDAINQAEQFNKAVGIDGVVLTKIDADAKGGCALSIAYAIGKPIIFLGIGQNYDDLIEFDAKWLVERIFRD